MFLLNMQSKTPIFQQIEQQMIRLMDAGVLKPGDRLPSVRQMATENGINPNTVAKAYAELESKGRVYNLPKKGVYVAEYEKTDDTQERLLTILRPLKENGMTKEEMMRTVEKLYGKE